MYTDPVPSTAEMPPSAGFLWMMPTSFGPTQYRSSPSTMRGQKRWSTSWPPASLPPSRYLPTPFDVQVPDLSLRPLMQNSMNSAHGVLLLVVVVGLHHVSTSSSSHSAAPKSGSSSRSLSLMIQMPSPDEPRFCLITRGWKAIVFLKPALNASSRVVRERVLEADVEVAILVSASLAPI